MKRGWSDRADTRAAHTHTHTQEHGDTCTSQLLEEADGCRVVQQGVCMFTCQSFTQSCLSCHLRLRLLSLRLFPLLLFYSFIPYFLPPSFPLLSALVPLFAVLSWILLSKFHSLSSPHFFFDYFLLFYRPISLLLPSFSALQPSSSVFYPFPFSSPLFYSLPPVLFLLIISRCFHLLLSLSADRYDGLHLLLSAPDDSRRVIR